MHLHSPPSIYRSFVVRLRNMLGACVFMPRHRSIFIWLTGVVSCIQCEDLSGQSIYTSHHHDTHLKAERNVMCEIDIPDEGYVYYDPDIIFVAATVSDSANVVKVDFYMDSLHLGTDYQAPFRNMNLFNSPMGPYDLVAVATYYNGITAISAPVGIIVRCVREDLDNNGRVNISDFLILLGSFGLSCTGCHEDLTQDGEVNTFDFLQFLGALGITCE